MSDSIHLLRLKFQDITQKIKAIEERQTRFSSNQTFKKPEMCNERIQNPGLLEMNYLRTIDQLIRENQSLKSQLRGRVKPCIKQSKNNRVTFSSHVKVINI